MQYFIGIYLKRLFYYTAINRARSTKKRETGPETKNETENRPHVSMSPPVSPCLLDYVYLLVFAVLYHRIKCHYKHKKTVIEHQRIGLLEGESVNKIDAPVVIVE